MVRFDTDDPRRDAELASAAVLKRARLAMLACLLGGALWAALVVLPLRWVAAHTLDLRATAAPAWLFADRTWMLAVLAWLLALAPLGWVVAAVPRWLLTPEERARAYRSGVREPWRAVARDALQPGERLLAVAVDEPCDGPGTTMLLGLSACLFYALIVVVSLAILDRLVGAIADGPAEVAWSLGGFAILTILLCPRWPNAAYGLLPAWMWLLIRAIGPADYPQALAWPAALTAGLVLAVALTNRATHPLLALTDRRLLAFGREPLPADPRGWCGWANRYLRSSNQTQTPVVEGGLAYGLRLALDRSAPLRLARVPGGARLTAPGRRLRCFLSREDAGDLADLLAGQGWLIDRRLDGPRPLEGLVRVAYLATTAWLLVAAASATGSLCGRMLTLGTFAVPAYEAARAGRVAESESLLGAAAATRPDEPLVTAMRARTLEELGRPAEALPLWREVARQVPDGVVGQAARERVGR